jgi:hypothetical protein
MKVPPLRTDRPLYCRLLHLKHVRPNSWQRAALGEGAIAVAGILVLADLASLWVLPALPLAVAVVVKGHDLLAGLLLPVGHSADSLESVVADGWVSAEVDGLAALPGPESSALSAQPRDPLVPGEVLTGAGEESAVRVIAKSARRATARPGAAAARAQVTANRSRRKADG